MSLNRVCVMGRLTRDPELRRTNSGTAVTSFSLAVERDFKDKNTGERATDFLDVIAWRNTAEFVERYLEKGRQVVVEGRLQSRNWEDRDGHKRKAVEIVADSVYFADSKRSEGNGQVVSYNPPAQEFSEIEDDDELPF